jgi:hypothetical protein
LNSLFVFFKNFEDFPVFAFFFFASAQVDDLDLSELCRTINEPSDHGDENIDETVSANTLNDSLTIEKDIQSVCRNRFINIFISVIGGLIDSST